MAYVAKRQYRLAEDTIDHADLDELIRWLETYPWLTQGALVREFEEAWANWLGVRHAVFVNSGSSANLLMYYALVAQGALPNFKVVLPAVAWSTTYAPAIQFGFAPHVVDAEPRTFGMDPNRLEDVCKRKRPAAVVIVHILGVPCELDAILDLQRRYEFVLLEDACAATGSKFRGKFAGTFGQLSSFSLFFGHHASTIEGGMVCTNDDALYHILLQLRSHGWAKDLPPEIESEQAIAAGVSGFSRPFTFYYPGFHFGSRHLNARHGHSQISKRDDVTRPHVAANRASAVAEIRLAGPSLHVPDADEPG